MPYLSQQIIISGTKHDKRIKLTKEDKELIVWLRENEEISYKKLALRFGVSKRTIIFVCKPETLEACKQKRKERGGSSLYYDKEKSTESTRIHRKYKQDLLINGLIKFDSENPTDI